MAVTIQGSGGGSFWMVTPVRVLSPEEFDLFRVHPKKFYPRPLVTDVARHWLKVRDTARRPTQED
jgi:hypothetical protein